MKTKTAAAADLTESTARPRRSKFHNPGWYYVEHAIDDGENVTFRVYVTDAPNRPEAEREAREDAKRAHPKALVSFFLSRKVSAIRAEQIANAIRNNAWSGWFEEGNSYD